LAISDISVRAQELFAQANEIADGADRWEAARDLYEACVRDSPRFAPAWVGLARCHQVIAAHTTVAAVREHERAQAVRAFEQALALEPELPLAHTRYAQLEVDFGMAPEATVRLLALLDRRGPNADAYAALVRSLRFCGLLDASRAAHDHARGLDRTLVTSVAHTYWLRGQFEAALAEATGGNGYMAGLALASMGREADAIMELRRREPSTRDDRARELFISLRTGLEGDGDRAVAALRRAEIDLADPEALYYVARTYAKFGEAEAAVTAIARVLDAGFICYPALIHDPWLEGLRAGGGLAQLTNTARAHHVRARETFLDADGERLLA
jgi:tetratricopeptide (TPR) repeat protein